MQITEYKIDNNIPVPTKGNRLTGLQAVIRSLEVGQSVFCPGEKYSNISSRCGVAALRSGDDRKYSLRTVTENNVAGVRVWRIA